MGLKGDQGTARALNRRLVLNQLRRNGPMSRSAITAASGLSPAAISFVTADLINEGLLVERAAVHATAGRRPVPLDIDYSSKLSIGLKVRETSVSGVITDLATRAIANLDVPLPNQQPQTVVKVAASCVRRLMAEAGVGPARMIGVGVALAGQVDAEQGVCRQMQRSGWRDVPIARMLADIIELPVWVDNDANAFAVSQQLFGHGRGHANLAAIAIGRGVGAGLVIGGRLYRGASGAAGEFGHSLAERGGRPCECGRKGCLETYCGDPGLVQTWNERDPSTVGKGPSDLAAAAEAGDATARKVLRDSGRRLGRHIAALVNVLDPEILVFGGEGVHYGRFIFEPLRRELEAHVYGDVPQLAVNWENDGWQRGAAALAIQHFFDFEITGGHSSQRTSRLPMSA